MQLNGLMRDCEENGPHKRKKKEKEKKKVSTKLRTPSKGTGKFEDEFFSNPERMMQEQIMRTVVSRSLLLCLLIISLNI